MNKDTEFIVPTSMPEAGRRRFIKMTSVAFAAGVSSSLAACGGGGGSSGGGSSGGGGGGSGAAAAPPPSSTTPPPAPLPQFPPSSPPPVAASGAIVAFSLRSSVTASNVPFSLGQTFRKGDVPAGQALALDIPSFQVTPISSWDDGSVKHAIVAGRVNLTANTSKTVSISAGTASGVAMTESDLISASPSASVTYGSYGTVSLSSLLGVASARVLIENAGPQYAAFQYVANFPGDSSIRAVFYVQLWAGGNYRVRVAVENGTVSHAGSTKSGSAVVTIAGVQRFSGLVSMDDGTRWDAVGANFSEAGVLHNVVYLRATKLVPNFGYVVPNAATLNALQTAYTPMNGLNFETDMGATGYDEGIGLLPHWDALYCTSGDSRARDSSIAHGSAYGCYGIYFRDANTKKMPKFSDFPTAYANDESMYTTKYRWEFAHHPNAGYLPWLMTAERYFLETMQANAWASYYTNNPNGGGANRTYVSQTRGQAWRLRTIALVAGLSPTNDLFAADCRANVAANFANWKTLYVDTNNPATGLVAIWEDLESVPGYQHSLFMSFFLVSTIGWIWDVELGLNVSQKATHQAVRDFSYRVPVGLTGRGPAFGEYSYRCATGPYRTNIGPDSNENNLYQTWGAVYAATYNDQLPSTDGLSILDSYADDTSDFSFPQSNWGHLITALSYAKDHGASGASAGYARVTGASNWNANATKFNNWPSYGVLSRI